jgi:hypothetical protein
MPAWAEAAEQGSNLPLRCCGFRHDCRAAHYEEDTLRAEVGATPLELNQRSADYGSAALLLS